MPLDPDTAAASCSSALARLAVTGGPHVGWKSSTSKLGDKVISWQVSNTSVGVFRMVHDVPGTSERYIL